MLELSEMPEFDSVRDTFVGSEEVVFPGEFGDDVDGIEESWLVLSKSCNKYKMSNSQFQNYVINSEKFLQNSNGQLFYDLSYSSEDLPHWYD